MSLRPAARWQDLADVAMGVFSSSDVDIKRAVLAQWTCEQHGPWPPTHNNPGFVTASAMRSVGWQAAAATSSPGAGFLAQFPTPERGAEAYAYLLMHGRRYAPVRAAIAKGDGAAYLKAVTSAGYGTRYSCCVSAYRALGGTISSVGSGGSGGSSGGDPTGTGTQTGFDLPNPGDIASAIGGIPAAIGDVARNIALLVFILGLIFLGLYQLAGGSETAAKVVGAGAKAAVL